MKKTTLAAIGLTLGLAVPAAAADMPPAYKAAPVAAAYNWTGFYIGANLGWATSKNCYEFDGGGGFINEGCHDAHGFLAGGQAGYRAQFGNWVFGLEAQGDWANLRGASNNLRLLAAPSVGNRTKIDAIGLFTGQVGYNFDTLLVYAKGGAGLTTNSYETFLNGALVTFHSAKDTRIGAAAGVGFEYAMTPNWSWGVEYNHLFLGEKTFGRNTAAPFPVIVGTERVKQDLDMVTFRVNYRFGAPAIAARY